ncbi:uncharacterized protein LOC123690675 [Pieris rapae]|uniref:uncharacterized protein LOC123690675 n=1 Tax=Pieris rapae TaxID=64459 RepID=UPI001E27F99C|nr:uncharacterized protein LOC123690675 [Pieris rapae]
MKLLLIGLAVCLRATYAQWGIQRNDVANFDRSIWQPTWVDQNRYRSYVTPNWANGWNSYTLNPFQFWSQPYSTLPYPTGLGSRYLYQNRWNQQYPIRQYQDNWSSRNNYNVYANQPWNGLGWSQRQHQEYRPFRTEEYQGPIAQYYYPRQRYNVYPERVQPSYNWNPRNWNLNRQYHPINAYHPYPIRSYQPTSVNTHKSYPIESYHPYPIRSHHSYPSETVQFNRPSWRQPHQPNLVSENRRHQNEHSYKKAYNPFSVQSDRPSPISIHRPSVNSHGTERNWYLNSHYDPLLTSHQPSVTSDHLHDLQSIRSHPSSVQSHLIRPQRFYPLNYYLNQQAINHQHPKGVHYHNDNKNNFYHLYHSRPSQSQHVAVKKHVVPFKKEQIDLSTLWFLNQLLKPVSTKPNNRSSRNHPGFKPFDVVIVKKIVSPVKSKTLEDPHRRIHLRPDVNSYPIKENLSTVKPVFNGNKPVSIKPFRPLHEKVSKNPQQVLVNWNQPPSVHPWYPKVNPWHPAKDIGAKPTTAAVA